MKLMKLTAEINKAIESIAKRGAKLDGDIQVAAVSVIAHLDEHGDFTLAERLVHAMPKGSRKLALVEFLLAFGKVRLLDKENAEDKDRITAGGVFGFAKDKTTNVDGAMEKAWYEFKPEAPVLESFDVQAAVAALIKKVEGLQKKGVTIKHAEVLRNLKSPVSA